MKETTSRLTPVPPHRRGRGSLPENRAACHSPLGCGFKFIQVQVSANTGHSAVLGTVPQPWPDTCTALA